MPLEKVLPHLIESDQSGYIKVRFIGENIRLISDIIEQHENKEGMILFLDFHAVQLYLKLGGCSRR